MEFRILGPLEVRDGEGSIALAGRKQRALLTLLLLRANEHVSTDRLVDELWGEDAPRTATASLQNAISQLRKLLGAGILHTRPGGYLLEVRDGELDLARFERMVREARDAPPAERAGRLREALGLWRGAALADLELEDFAQPEIRRLEDMRLNALEERIDADLENGLHAELVPELEALARRHPVRERMRGQLMLALYRCGRQADALAAYHDARRTLVEELGIEPSRELQTLYGSILRQERALTPTVTVTLDDHFGEVLRALGSGRLVTVVGPQAGGGMTSAEIAAFLAERFECPAETARALPHVAQFVASRNGIGALRDELHAALDRDFAPAQLHQWLATVPAFLRSRELPPQLVVTTNLDTALERALTEAGEEFDVVSYVAEGRDRGKFLHVSPDRAARVIDEPNAYTGRLLEDRTVLLKIHGGVDRAPERGNESFAVSEDDHIDYLADARGGSLPVTLAARLRRSHLLFVGYTVDDWSLRVFMRRVWSHDRLAYRSWAVHEGAAPLARELWREAGVDVFETPVDQYATELARRSAELEALGALS